MGWVGGFDWDKLLESKRIIIVAEAGTGKTFECRTRQEGMWDKGEPAFYLDLAELAVSSLRELLPAKAKARFDAWRLAQSDIATFFLDSIEEFKLTLGSFEAALRRMSKAVAGQLSRVRILITTRPITYDYQLVETHLEAPKSVNPGSNGLTFADIATGRSKRESIREKGDDAPAWRNVALMPLSDLQIREIALTQGIEDVDALMADIHRRVRTHREQTRVRRVSG